MLGALSLLSGCDFNFWRMDGPQSTIDVAGPVAHAQLQVFYTTVWVTLVIFILVAAVLAYATLKSRARSEADEHAEPPEQNNPQSIVLSNDTFFGWREIRAMQAVPELVFVNCCHLGAFDSNQLLTRSAQERTRFAVGVAEELIAIGVRCVVAAA